MKKPLPLSFLILLSIFTNAQSFFKEINFTEAQKEASKTGKLIFLQLLSPECSQCNEVAEKAFKNSMLAETLKKNFICIKVASNDPDRKEIEEICNSKNGYGSFFLDQNKALIHSYRMTSSNKDGYLTQIDIALNKSKLTDNILSLEEKYKKNETDINLLQSLLLKKKDLGLETQSLLDTYANLVPKDSTLSDSDITFIMKMIPLIDSKPYRVATKDWVKFNKVWFTLPLQERISINNKIIYKSRNFAISQKNEMYAIQVASFAKNVNAPNTQIGKKAYDENMLLYFKGINDTSQYLTRAIAYYDNYFMGLSVDSIKKIDTLLLQKMTQNAKKDTVFNFGGKMVVNQQVAFTGVSQSFARDLNSGAWAFYNMTGNPLYLNKALTWSSRSLDFFKSPDIIDTYARLLYKLGNKDEAMRNEKMAIELQASRNFSTNEFEYVLSKMKLGLTSID